VKKLGILRELNKALNEAEPARPGGVQNENVMLHTAEALM
jgi:hypothetical protein